LRAPIVDNLSQVVTFPLIRRDKCDEPFAVQRCTAFIEAKRWANSHPNTMCFAVQRCTAFIEALGSKAVSIKLGCFAVQRCTAFIEAMS